VTYHFLNLQSILEKDQVRSRAVLTIIQQDNHGIGIHLIPRIKLPILEPGNNLLGISLSGFFECLDSLGVFFRKMGFDSFHVSFQVGQVGFLVKGGGLETHAVDDVVDCFHAVFDALVGFFCGWIGAWGMLD
jgi:hypothetical protein